VERRLVQTAGAVLLLSIVGCAPSASVTGKVTYKGKALPGGRVIFLLANGQVASGEITKEGTYTIPKSQTGEAKVTVETSAPPQIPKGAGGRGGLPPGAPPEARAAYEGAKDASTYVPIPERYRDPEKSGLKYTIKGGPNTYDIDL
jgi:hypothetical protein